MPPRARKAAGPPEEFTMDQLRDMVEGMNERLSRLTAPSDSVYDPEGYVIGHAVFIEHPQAGDLIATASVPGMIPMTYRYTGPGWRGEYGMPTNDVPRPWRLLWRNSLKQTEADQPKPKRGPRKAEEDSDGDE
jgi:hypothetical protein